MLLGKRSIAKRWAPGAWDLPGGHIEAGEDPGAALIREMREELGIRVTRFEQMFVVEQGFVMHGFVVHRWAGEITNAAPEEHDELRFFAPDELRGLHLAHPEYPMLLAG